MNYCIGVKIQIKTAAQDQLRHDATGQSSGQQVGEGEKKGDW